MEKKISFSLKLKYTNMCKNALKIKVFKHKKCSLKYKENKKRSQEIKQQQKQQ